MSEVKRRVLVVVMDGVGVRQSDYGNAVRLASTPQLDALGKNGFYRTLKAHGTYVGLPSDADIGNSEVGHNAMGAGRVFDQGAKLVQNAIDSGRMYKGQTWLKLVETCRHKTLHFIGLLSDGNVHAHENHLYAMMRQAFAEGVQKIRVHPLLDGRDVGEKSAEAYVERLMRVISELKSRGCDVAVASSGGRMMVTMDRYEADWSMVERGWKAHVLAEADYRFPSLPEALAYFRSSTELSDQNIPGFVIEGHAGIHDGEGVVLFNFRGDRAIEIARAFAEHEETFRYFDRRRVPQVFFTGMMEYDGDRHIPERYLVSPPAIDDTLSEYLVHLGARQFACSETQKFGHVTYFWNGNRSGMFDKSIEEYAEIASDNISFDLKPWMKAFEITELVIDRMKKGSFDFGRINFPNGDMVGHTGNLEASIVAMSTVDLCIGRLMKAAEETGTLLIITADHGNCDEMFDTTKEGPADWRSLAFSTRPKPKTSHTLNPVPLYIFDGSKRNDFRLRSGFSEASIGYIPNTALTLMGLKEKGDFLPSLVETLR